MSSIVCAGCHRQFTHAGYSCHLSMTTRASCRALYERHLDLSAVHHSSGMSGLSHNDLSNDVGPEVDNPGEYLLVQSQ